MPKECYKFYTYVFKNVFYSQHFISGRTYSERHLPLDSIITH